jgi:spore maturation protein CgeB
MPRKHQDRLCFLGSSHYKGDGGRRAKFKAISSAGYPMYRSKRIYHEEAADYYWNSAICPNFSCGDITSNRVMRVLSSGGFCLTESNADIRHSFTDGQELAMFNEGDIQHMMKQIKYYMGQPKLRHEIAMRGHEWTRDKSWTQQAEKMVRFIRGEDVPADGAAGEYVGHFNPAN